MPRVSDYLEGELRAAEQRRLAQHEELCPECARLIRTLGILIAILPSLRLPPAVSSEIAERTAQRVRAQIEEWS
jgi:anti-sigma factor RsiW